MNVKAGDMAVAVTNDHLYANLIFDVLHLAPIGVKFNLPDGTPHSVVAANHWVVKPIVPTTALFSSGKRKPATFGVVPDFKLRPIRPPEEPVTTDKPEEITA